MLKEAEWPFHWPGGAGENLKPVSTPPESEAAILITRLRS
jgi:hypothetical protein